jgi:hypothetical protein
MAFKKVSGAKKFFRYGELKKGEVLIAGGTYLGQEDGKFGIEHNFKLPSGELAVLNSAGHLNWLVQNFLPVGTVCNITYAGKDVINKGDFKGKESHRFELEVDDGGAQPTAKAMPTESFDDDITL